MFDDEIWTIIEKPIGRRRATEIHIERENEARTEHSEHDRGARHPTPEPADVAPRGRLADRAGERPTDALIRMP